MRLLAALAILLLGAALPAWAQEEPPARVGRVSYVSGNLAFHMAGETEWSAASVNYPVATGGSFWTDASARAEMRIGPSTIDIAGGTELDVTNLNEQVAQLGLPQGRVYLRLRQLDSGQSFEIDTPQGGVWLLQPGAYDIDSGSADAPARVAVLEGSARFVGGGADTGIKSGDVAVLTGSNPVTVQLQRATSDEFVAWAQSRNTEETQVATPKYVSPQMTGYADLAPYGNWQQNPQYGQVWYPSQVPADWAPYRDGRWVWVQPWGWSWVDQEPWGFAPSHYGRWAYIGNRWGWVPGQYAARPVYAPALVAFVGFGAGIGAAAGRPVGWFPLAPGEVYWPSYTRNVNYIRNVNVTNVRNINTIVNVNNITIRNNGPRTRVVNETFANRRFATVVPRRVFANAGRVAPAAIHVSEKELRQAQVTTRPPRITPAVARATGAEPGRSRPEEALSGADRAAIEHGKPGERASGPNRPGAPPAAEAASGRERTPQTARPPGINGKPSNTAALPPPAKAGAAGQNQPAAGPPKNGAQSAAEGPNRAAPGPGESKGAAKGPNAAAPPNRPGVAEPNRPGANQPKGEAPGRNAGDTNRATKSEPAGKGAAVPPPGAASPGPAAQQKPPAAANARRETGARAPAAEPPSKSGAESRPAPTPRRETPAARPAPARAQPPKVEEKQSVRAPKPLAPAAHPRAAERPRPAPHQAAAAPHPQARAARAPAPKAPPAAARPQPAVHEATAHPAAKAQAAKSAEAHGKESTKHD